MFSPVNMIWLPEVTVPRSAHDQRIFPAPVVESRRRTNTIELAATSPTMLAVIDVTQCFCPVTAARVIVATVLAAGSCAIDHSAGPVVFCASMLFPLFAAYPASF